ncbi:hypothetical protein [Algicola sagamiensis]|uniref:hypothetical protein n=1 Tax=Algicola sagamiensis TaxID=163869 RepID=UPI000364E091|nr:hypothetical protein [Algicola sagamiensis]
MQKKILIVTGIIGVGLISLLSLTQQQSPEQANTTPPTPIEAPEQTQLTTLAQTDITDSQAQLDIPPKEIEKKEKKAWRKPTPEFADFLDLSDKALVSHADQDQFKAIIEDPERVATARKILLKKPEKDKLDWAEEKRRLDSILYVSTLLTGKYSSIQTDLAVELVQDILLAKNFEGLTNKELKRSLVGDKVELGVEFAVYHPEAWDTFKDQHGSDPYHQKLITYIDNFAGTRKEQLLNHVERITARLKARAKEKQSGT